MSQANIEIKGINAMEITSNTLVLYMLEKEIEQTALLAAMRYIEIIKVKYLSFRFDGKEIFRVKKDY